MIQGSGMDPTALLWLAGNERMENKMETAAP